MKIKLSTQDLAVISICSALYAIAGYLTGFISFYGIGFLPAVIIPAVFAALYGPWVGGISGAIGIFIRDIFVHGNPALSLTAGVPANFVLFFLIGYLYTKNISLKQALTCVSLATIGLSISLIALLSNPSAITAMSIWTGGLSTRIFLIAFILTVLVSLGTITLVSIRWKEWRSYAIGAIVGQIAGGFLLSVTVWLVSPLFLSIISIDGGNPLTAIFILPIFVWTIATEIPFLLIAGPPIIKAIQNAFPTLQHQNKPLKKGETVDQKNR
ncbi:MAG: ECF transporter S component [Candidatus Bathyarchaeota archaeon]|nr:ECF transporter S component [Candidatus Termiticorpusculum sp.]